jgi:hypothetical protein
MLGISMKFCREVSSLDKNVKKIHYLKIYQNFIGAGDINWPLQRFVGVEYHQAVRIAEDVYISDERARTLGYTYVAYIFIYRAFHNVLRDYKNLL